MLVRIAKNNVMVGGRGKRPRGKQQSNRLSLPKKARVSAKPSKGSNACAPPARPPVAIATRDDDGSAAIAHAHTLLDAGSAPSAESLEAFTKAIALAGAERSLLGIRGAPRAILHTLANGSACRIRETRATASALVAVACARGEGEAAVRARAWGARTLFAAALASRNPFFAHAATAPHLAAVAPRDVLDNATARALSMRIANTLSSSLPVASAKLSNAAGALAPIVDIKAARSAVEAVLHAALRIPAALEREYPPADINANAHSGQAVDDLRVQDKGMDTRVAPVAQADTGSAGGGEIVKKYGSADSEAALLPDVFIDAVLCGPSEHLSVGARGALLVTCSRSHTDAVAYVVDTLSTRPFLSLHSEEALCAALGRAAALDPHTHWALLDEAQNTASGHMFTQRVCAKQRAYRALLAATAHACDDTDGVPALAVRLPRRARALVTSIRAFANGCAAVRDAAPSAAALLRNALLRADNDSASARALFGAEYAVELIALADGASSAPSAAALGAPRAGLRAMRLAGAIASGGALSMSALKSEAKDTGCGAELSRALMIATRLRWSDGKALARTAQALLRECRHVHRRDEKACEDIDACVSWWADFT